MTSTWKAALHEDTRKLLADLAASGIPPFETMTPEQARETAASFTDAVGFPKVEVGAVEDRRLSGKGGATVPVRIYHPPGAGRSPRPGVLFFHGGGWVVGGLDSHDDLCRRFCRDVDAVVVAVDYRLAPDHRFPAAVDDVMTATAWLYDEADRLGVDKAKLVVAGDSAGGGLAAVIAIAAARGEAPPIAYQVLFYPVTDLGSEHPSYARITEGFPVTAPTMSWFRDLYLRDPADAQDWRASPLRAPSLAGAAPAFVLTVHHDPLCDEGVAYARRLAEEGVEVAHVHFSAHAHGLISMGGVMRDAEAALGMATGAVNAALRPPITA